MMNPRSKQIVITIISCIVTVWLAVNLAGGSLFWPGLFGMVAVAAILVYLLAVEVDVILVGLVIFGYIVGNRGFAQIMPIQGVPLLPAEAALMVALTWRAVRWAFSRAVPFRHDALDWIVVLWLVAGTARFAFDFPRHGFLAARDFAVVYYALFFFLVRHMATDAAARRYLVGCVIAGCVTLAVIFPLQELFPDFFFNTLVWQGTPLFYYKDDLALTLFAASSLLFFYWADGTNRWWAWPMACILFCYTMVGDVRAAMLASVLVLLMLIAARRWVFPVIQLCLAALGLMALIGVATITSNPQAEQKLAEMEAQARSIVSIDAPTSNFAPKFYKQDNNRFRLVWWRSVTLEVLQNNPVFGLGFGYDLAAGFVDAYDQELGDEFTARSPHSIAFTALGRMGLAGFVIWIAFSFVLLIRCWRVLRRPSTGLEVGLWCAVMIILISACFGVVLEGPMGAVVFWSLLGLASATPTDPQSTAGAESASPAPEPLPKGTSSV